MGGEEQGVSVCAACMHNCLFFRQTKPTSPTSFFKFISTQDYLTTLVGILLHFTFLFQTCTPSLVHHYSYVCILHRFNSKLVFFLFNLISLPLFTRLCPSKEKHFLIISLGYKFRQKN